MNPACLLVLLVSLPLLLGGCGDKEAVAETKPEPEPDGVDREELEFRGEFPNFIYYIKGSDTPYTDKAFSLHGNGEKKFELNFKDGKKEGLEAKWYANGQKNREVNYKDGKRDGLYVMWYEDGQKEWEGNYNNGLREGLWWKWHENGQKNRRENYKDGKRDGLYVMWYANGQKEWEGNYKNGMLEGPSVRWHESGEKMEERNYKDGKMVEGSEKFWTRTGQSVESYGEANE